MHSTQKIATCCYCGTKAALVLKGRERHELACSNCGAPLHDLKKLKSDARGDRELVRRSRSSKSGWHEGKRRKSPKKRRSRSLSQRMMEELWDVADDIFDIFD